MIEVKSLHDVYQLRSAQGANRPVKRVAEDLTVGAGAADSAGVDVIKISPEAAFRNKLDAEIKTYAQQTERGVSDARLEKIRQKYDGEGCPVPGADTAQAMFARLSTPSPVPLRGGNPGNRVSGDL